MMTIADLYNDTRGRVAPHSPEFSSALEPNWRGNPASDPSLAPANYDYQDLAYNEQVQNLADELLKKNQAGHSKQQAEMLKALLEQPSVNLFNAPTNPTEAAAQKIVQEHINAGQRGVNLWFADTARRKKEAADALQRNLAIRNQQMKEALFPIQKAQALQQYQLGKTQQQDTNRYREDQVAQRAQNEKDQQSARLEAQQQRDYTNALQLIQGGVSPDKLMQSFPRLSNEHFIALDEAGQALARGDQQQFDTIKRLAEDRTNELNQKVYGAESDYLDRNQGTGFFGGTVPEDVLMKRGQSAREEYLAGFNKDKNAGKSIYFDEATGQFVPIAAAPQGYTPLDRAMLARRRPATNVNPNMGGGYGGGYSQGPLPVPRDGIPMVRTTSELPAFSTYPSFRSPDGIVRRNPLYRPPQRTVAPPPQNWTTGYGNYGDQALPYNYGGGY